MVMMVMRVVRGKLQFSAPAESLFISDFLDIVNYSILFIKYLNKGLV
jgi:hypothetical protein